jgi:hypothetical protein
MSDAAEEFVVKAFAAVDSHIRFDSDADSKVPNYFRLAVWRWLAPLKGRPFAVAARFRAHSRGFFGFGHGCGEELAAAIELPTVF